MTNGSITGVSYGRVETVFR